MGVIQHCVVISDLHFGCSFALCPPSGFALDSGGKYHASKLQKVLWSWWEEFWDDWLPKYIGRNDFCVVINGDLLEGTHHKIVTPISHNLTDQLLLAETVLKPKLSRAAKFFVVRGTEAHGGASCQEEEKLAKLLGATPITQKLYSTYELLLDIEGVLIHFSHHTGSNVAGSEGRALTSEILEALADAQRWGGKTPTVFVRSHRHRVVEVRLPYKNGFILAFVTPSWQLKTPYVYKVVRNKLSFPQIGGSLISVVDGEVEIRHFVRTLSQGTRVKV